MHHTLSSRAVSFDAASEISPEPKWTGSLSFWLTISVLQYVRVLLRCWTADNSAVSPNFKKLPQNGTSVVWFFCFVLKFTDSGIREVLYLFSRCDLSCYPIRLIFDLQFTRLKVWRVNLCLEKV